MATPKKSFKRRIEPNICRFCRQNIGHLYGKTIPSIPIFKITENKDFKDILLCKRLEVIGIALDRNTSFPQSSCRKCARKIVNISDNILPIKENANKLVAVDNSSCVVVEKRGARSPASGLTKRVCQIDGTSPTSRSLFTNNPSSKEQSQQSATEDEMYNLMNLPVNVEENSVVKVCVYFYGVE